MTVSVNLFPLRLWAFVMLFFGVSGIISYFIASGETGFTFSFQLFTIIITTYYLLTGIGLLLFKSWGYRLFLFNLGMFYLAFPLGTYLAIKTNEYLKKNEIKRLYK